VKKSFDFIYFYMICSDSQKMVATNKEVLIALRTNFDKPDLMKDLTKRLQSGFPLS
jgi:hypothetical protein